jgi:alcohol dehydrogenase class IV
MWYFASPEIVFGEDALSRLDDLDAHRALIVCGKTVKRMGFVDIVKEHLNRSGIECQVFDEIEPEPTIAVVKRGANKAREYLPDLIIGLGGGSSIDAAKAIWVLYERPDIQLQGVTPFESLGLRKKARLVAIPTTSGTGSEANSNLVITDESEQKKLGLANREIYPDIAIVDHIFTSGMPPQLTADSGMDALTHAIEGYTSQCRNDFSDGLCLRAIQLVFSYLLRSYQNRDDQEAREKMHVAASIAGLGFGNSMLGIAHGMGHSLGSAFHVPHGRAVGMFLPYSVEFNGTCTDYRYSDIAGVLKLRAANESEAVTNVAEAIRRLAKDLNQPLTIQELGIPYTDFVDSLPTLVSNADTDTSTVMSARIPTSNEFEKLFRYSYNGKHVDF